MTDPIRKYVVEAIGTFFLVFTIVLAVAQNAALAPLAIGAALMVMIFAGGHISGGHFNPAVSLAIFIRGRIDPADLIGYWIAQFLGAALAALLGTWYFSSHCGPALSGKPMWQALVAEALFTFALAWVVLNVATSKNHPDNNFYGLAIGFTVLAGAVAVGAISGGAFNPAVGLGIAIAHLRAWGDLWIYLVGPLVGAVGAGVAFKVLNADDR
ncbi:MAG: MIP/aquaporin family protein [Marmoricola sp.]